MPGPTLGGTSAVGSMGDPRRVRPDELEIIVARELRKAGVTISALAVVARNASQPIDAGEYSVEFAAVTGDGDALREALIECRNETAPIGVTAVRALDARRSARRMELLIADLLDFTRGRLGGGIALEYSEVLDLEARLRHVVDEIASSHPERRVTFNVMKCARLHQRLNAFAQITAEARFVIGADAQVFVHVEERDFFPIDAGHRDEFLQEFNLRIAGGEDRGGAALR